VPAWLGPASRCNFTGTGEQAARRAAARRFQVQRAAAAVHGPGPGRVPGDRPQAFKLDAAGQAARMHPSTQAGTCTTKLAVQGAQAQADSELPRQ
jgi:hypothetical protein